MPIIETAAPQPTAIPGIAHVTLAGQDTGLTQLSVWRQSMDPGACTPPHVHACDEVVLCEAGAGEVEIEGRRHAVRAGQTLLLPAGLAHQIFNTGDAPLVTLAAFPATPVPVTLPDGQPLPLPWRS